MDKCVEIYILTHKEIKEEYDSSLYIPILNGSANTKQDYGYVRDDAGDNISKLHKNYSELTSEYWVWKNSNADIIGFCHYRRWYVKNLKLDKLTKSDILNDLDEYDIILPEKIKSEDTLFDLQKKWDVIFPDYDVTYEDYLKVGEVLENFFPDYAKTYSEVMNSNEMWACNMFISKYEIADEYFKWLFDVCDKLKNEIDFNEYDMRDSRVFGFIAERLLTTYIVKNNFNVKEYPLVITEGGRKHLRLYVLFSKFPFLEKFESFLSTILNKIGR